MSQAQQEKIKKDEGRNNSVFAFHPNVYIVCTKATKINNNDEI
jgi:hypothetical protein